MKELLTQYAAYNMWANKLMIDAMLQLSEDAVDKLIISSFRSIRATASHCWSAEDVWLQRLMKVEDTIWAESIFKGSFEDACANWRLASEGLVHFVNNSDEEALSGTLIYKDMQQKEHSTPVAMVLQHVFNHASYHRGQLVTMLRQVGESTIPRTDFIVFARLGQVV